MAYFKDFWSNSKSVSDETTPDITKVDPSLNISFNPFIMDEHEFLCPNTVIQKGDKVYFWLNAGTDPFIPDDYIGTIYHPDKWTPIVRKVWRLLDEGELFQSGDLFASTRGDARVWLEVANGLIGEKVILDGSCISRRRLRTKTVKSKWVCGHGIDESDTYCKVCSVVHFKYVDKKITV